MTTEYQVCQKCKHVYARKDSTGDSPFMSPDSFRSTMCTRCGGRVVWQSSPQAGETYTAGGIVAERLDRLAGAVLKLVFLAVIIGVCVFFLTHH